MEGVQTTIPACLPKPQSSHTPRLGVTLRMMIPPFEFHADNTHTIQPEQRNGKRCARHGLGGTLMAPFQILEGMW
jgi:hypothetical protein